LVYILVEPAALKSTRFRDANRQPVSGRIAHVIVNWFEVLERTVPAGQARR
jgi:hypothetical protein